MENDFRKNRFLPACREQFERKPQTPHPTLVLRQIRTTSTHSPAADCQPSTSRQNRQPTPPLKIQHQFTCHYKDCGKTFANTSSKTKNFQTHTNPDGFKCKICNQKFTNKDNLQHHMRRFHKIFKNINFLLFCKCIESKKCVENA